MNTIGWIKAGLKDKHISTNHRRARRALSSRLINTAVFHTVSANTQGAACANPQDNPAHSSRVQNTDRNSIHDKLQPSGKDHIQGSL